MTTQTNDIHSDDYENSDGQQITQENEHKDLPEVLDAVRFRTRDRSPYTLHHTVASAEEAPGVRS